MKTVLLLLALVSSLAWAQTGVLEMPPSTQFEVNARAVMSARPGIATRRTRVVTGTPAGDATFNTGAFRVTCASTHHGFFDPIVYPNIAGRSHLHSFFGNSTIAHDTDTSGLGSASHASSCAGGSINKSGYWIPSMIDTATGFPLVPSTNVVYYKSTEGGFYEGSQVQLELITVPPAGLRMIAGNPTGSTSNWSGRYDCLRLSDSVTTTTQNIPTDCPGGTHELIMIVRFPHCWDGVNLDSTDHQSHMAVSGVGGCPGTHPVPIPVISFNVHWQIPAGSTTANWRLASDTYSLAIPAGYSGHGDWINGWEQVYLEAIVNNCIRQGRDCHANLLGKSPDTIPGTAVGYEMF